MPAGAQMITAQSGDRTANRTGGTYDGDGLGQPYLSWAITTLHNYYWGGSALAARAVWALWGVLHPSY